MDNPSAQSLEDFVTSVELATAGYRKVVTSLAAALRTLADAAAVGDIRRMRRAQARVDQLSADAPEKHRALQDALQMREADYLGSADYRAELVAAGTRVELELGQHGDRLFSPPYEIRILPNESVVMVGRQRLSKLRPSRLIEEIKHLHARGADFEADAFLDVVYRAFVLVAGSSRNSIEHPHSVPLTDIYALLTLLPEAARQYTLDDFARDVYLLDRSGAGRERTATRGRLQFVASSGTRSAKVLTVMSNEGVEQKYYAITFIED